MSSKIRIIFVGLIIFLFSSFLFGQVPRREIDRHDNEPNREVTNAQKILRREGQFPGAGFSSSAQFKLSKESKKRLKLEENEFAAYRDFLKQKKTGIFKLLTFPVCTENQGEKEKKKCLTEFAAISQQASSYSFRAKEYNSMPFADLSLRSGYLLTAPYMAFSLMVDLGDVPLDDLAIDSEGIKYLAEYKIPEALSDANEQISAFNKSVEVGKHRYFRGMAVSENRTFAIRSSGYITKIPILRGEKTEDVLTVFRIVQKDSDGSVTILWKELKRQDGINLKCATFCYEEEKIKK